MKRFVLTLALLSSSACNLDIDPPPAVWEFQADEAAGEGPALFLTAEDIDNESINLVLHSKGTGPLYGVAFRLSYPDEAFSFDFFETSAPWTTAPIIRAVEARPGLLIAVVSQQGLSEGLAEGEIARIRLTATGSGQHPLSLSRTTVMDPDGRSLAVAVRGGTVVR